MWGHRAQVPTDLIERHLDKVEVALWNTFRHPFGSCERRFAS
jgi:hypothetical protein